MKTEIKFYIQRTGTITSLIGLVTGYLIIGTLVAIDDGLLNGLLWFNKLDDIWPNIIIGCMGMVLSAYLLCGPLIIAKFYRPLISIFTGASLAIVSLFGGVIIGSTLGFLQESHFNQWPQQLPSNLFDYYAKPLIWIGLFGGIPAAIIGGIWGWIVYRKKKHFL